MDAETHGIKTIELEDIIREINQLFPNSIESIYLFGSRGYRTNSNRSDIDLIVFSKVSINEGKLKVFGENHKYLDFFVGDNSYIHSLVNDSSIKVRNGYDSLIKQLDAIRLWDSDNGFDENNRSYLSQDIKSNVKWHPSSFSGIDPIIDIKKFRNNYSPNISARQFAFINEAIECYENENWLAFISMMGGFLETLLLDLIVAYEGRVRSLYSALFQNYHANIGDTSVIMSVKSRMEKFINHITLNDPNFGKLYLKDKYHVSFLETTFDVARKLRNNVDHCLEYNYDDQTCSSITILFKTNIQTVVDAIDLLKNNPAL